MSGELGNHVGELVSTNLGLIPGFPEPRALSRDITPLIANGTAFRELMQVLRERYAGKINAITELESRDFVLSAPLAAESRIGMLTIYKAGKPPGHVIGIDYALEYRNARMETRPESVTSGAEVLIIDNVLAVGGTVEASMDLLRQCGVEAAIVAVLLELEAFSGRKILTDKKVSVGSALLV